MVQTRRRRGGTGSVEGSRRSCLPPRACGERLRHSLRYAAAVADSAASIGAAKRIGPGSKLRLLEVAEFYVQGALSLELRKVKGTENPANFGTKHPKTGPEVRQALPSVCGMATEALSRKGTIKSIQASPWKMRTSGSTRALVVTKSICSLQWTELCPGRADPSGSPLRLCSRPTGLGLPLEAVRGTRGWRGDEVPRPRAWMPLHARTRHILFLGIVRVVRVACLTSHVCIPNC